MFNERHEISVMNAIDKEIGRVRSEIIGPLAAAVYKINKDDQDAETLAIAFMQGEPLPDRALESFTRKRSIEMWAEYYPPFSEPDTPYSYLNLISSKVNGRSTEDQVSPLIVTPQRLIAF